MNFLDKLQSKYKIILASSSPRRQHLLQSVGMHFEVIPPDIDETKSDISLPENYCKALAEAKAQAIKQQTFSKQPAIIIAADTIVVKDSIIINKPSSKQNAAFMLQNLSNSKHEVYTGVSVINTATDRQITDFAKTAVYFRSLSEEEIWEYVESGKPMDKAGSYGIQDDYGALFVQKIEGCFYNVVGLPLELLYRMLLKISE